MVLQIGAHEEGGSRKGVCDEAGGEQKHCAVDNSATCASIDIRPETKSQGRGRGGRVGESWSEGGTFVWK